MKCLLPFENMMVLRDGRVRVCCHNTIDMGDLTNQTAEEIWNGENFNKLREHIKRGDFTFGCDQGNCPIPHSEEATRTKMRIDKEITITKRRVFEVISGQSCHTLDCDCGELSPCFVMAHTQFVYCSKCGEGYAVSIA